MSRFESRLIGLVSTSRRRRRRRRVSVYISLVAAGNHSEIQELSDASRR